MKWGALNEVGTRDPGNRVGQQFFSLLQPPEKSEKGVPFQSVRR
jgi:hypothetical protein